MKHYIAVIAVCLVVCTISVHSTPLYQPEQVYMESDQGQEVMPRERRSPGRGKFEIDANDERDEQGRRDKHVEGRYKQKWGKDDGPQFEVETHYRRNFVRNQPSEQHGARAKLTIPFGDDD